MVRMKVGDYVRHKEYGDEGPLHHRWTYRVTAAGVTPNGIPWVQINGYKRLYTYKELEKVSDIEALEFTLLNKHTPFLEIILSGKL